MKAKAARPRKLDVSKIPPHKALALGRKVKVRNPCEHKGSKGY